MYQWPGKKATVADVLVAVALQQVLDAVGRRLHVQDLDEFVVHHAHDVLAGLQQRVDGPHGDGPAVLPAAEQNAAARENLLLLEADVQEVRVLVGPPEKALRRLLYDPGEPQDPAQRAHPLQTCGGNETRFPSRSRYAPTAAGQPPGKSSRRVAEEDQLAD